MPVAVQLLDGTCDRAALAAALDEWARRQNREPMTAGQLSDALDGLLRA